MDDLDLIQKVAKCLRVPLKDLQMDDNQIITCSVNGEKVQGFMLIVTELAKLSDTEIAKQSFKSFVVELQILQWLQYIKLFVMNSIKDKDDCLILLDELNDIFENKSYIVETYLTLADVVMFFALYTALKPLSPLEKRKYLNLSRWCNHVQQLDQICPKEEQINFNIIYINL